MTYKYVNNFKFSGNKRSHKHLGRKGADYLTRKKIKFYKISLNVHVL